MLKLNKFILPVCTCVGVHVQLYCSSDLLQKKNLSTCFPEGGWVRVKRNLLSMYVAYGLPIPCKWPESLSMYVHMYVCMLP